MAQEMDENTHPESSPPKEAQEEANLWKHRGVEAVYFQREAHVSFWTVMGGLATAALLTQLSSLVEQLQSSRWQLALYFLSSILVIIHSWTQTTWATLILRWTINVPINLLMFFGQFSLAIQCLLVTYPPGWAAATGFLLIFTLLHQLHFSRTGAWRIFSPGRVREIKASLWIYGFWTLICLAGGVHLYWLPSALAETIWGVVALASSIAALILQHIAIQHEKQELGIP